MYWRSSGHFWAFLGHLLLPELHNLKLDGLENPGSAASADPLISFLAASTHLETISICSSTFSKSCLTTFLCGLPPTICRLDIFENRERHPWVGAVLDDDDVLATLELRPDSSTVCPALLELVISPFNAISDEALFRVITSRMPTLRRVDVAFDREMEVDILPRLQSFVESGAQISITYPTVPLGYFSPWIGLPDRPLGSS
ncbi:hypothetical protein MSAN_00080000 [Mycena sanguinolenta]|uniref:Uncharacterized protein n=1 Tax=Mycena sanguinolenta TaxID=230812 RepID=A0A8H7DKD9_9AGAR|nr:hypothetical protein MSAN_00080000 [Mycena sanguinolenta]